MREVEQIYLHGIKQLKRQIMSEENGEILIHIQQTLDSPAPYTLLYEILKPYGFNTTQVKDILESNDSIPGKQFQAEEYLLTKGRTYWRLFNILEKEDEHTLMADNGTYYLNNVTFTLDETEITPEFEIPKESHICLFRFR